MNKRMNEQVENEAEEKSMKMIMSKNIFAVVFSQ
jgi:hypothetical protein